MPISKKYLCIHGHFYQPPREDPWLGFVPPEGSAGPGHDWNERIARESYAPLSRARVLGEGDRIREIVNCYEYMSFNFGPTLMLWMERGDPDTYSRILEGDARSAARLGHGNALAQIQHHVIMPLASDRDKEVETAWAVADFQARFGRDPEGLWLSETAVDVPTLEVLAKAGIRFTILAPRQAVAVTDDKGQWHKVDENSLDISQPYLAELPSGRSIALFFYSGAISQAVAFERLLASGDAFMNRLAAAARPGLLSLATDGETYGHHFSFGEMGLAYVLTRIRDDGSPREGGLKLTNFATYLAANPPRRKVRIKEPSSWSCVHGVERWRSDCGCNIGECSTWRQSWRAPLRSALANCRAEVDKHFFSAGTKYFRDAGAALKDYGRVVVRPNLMDEFAARHLVQGADATTAFKLLVMQRNSLASMASCSWFFDDLDRLEPINAMRYSLRAMEFMSDTGGKDALPEFVDAVSLARSNRETTCNGRSLFETFVLPARETPASFVAQALALETGALKAGRRFEAAWPYVRVEIEVKSARKGRASGKAVIVRKLLSESRTFDWSVEYEPANPFEAAYRAVPETESAKLAGSEPFRPNRLTWRKRQALAVESARRLEAERWESGLDPARQILASFQPRVESQKFQNLYWAWGRFRAALTWLFVMGEAENAVGRSALKHFLRNVSPCEPEKEAARLRIEARIMACLRGVPPDYRLAASMVERAAEIELGLDLWAAQNLFWDTRPKGPEAEDMAGMLKFAPGLWTR